MKYQKILNSAKNSRSLRELPDYSACSVDFISNDYLGMADCKIAHQLLSSQAGRGSRLIAGNAPEALACEAFLAKHYDAEAALVFNSGYTANLGLFSCLAQKDEIVLYDEYCHASISDGLRLSLGKSFGFKHNDLNVLESKLQQFQGNSICVVVEACYSMEGDFANLATLFELSKRYDFKIIVDEAHSLGICGENGLGLAHKFAENPALLARVLTFGKSIGAHGAAVLTNTELKSYLIHACRPFIYTTALPPESYLRIQKCVDFVKQNEDLRTKLQSNIQKFCASFNTSNSHIQSIQIKGINEIKSIVLHAKNKGIALKGVWSPTVPEGQERLRISLHSFNTADEIQQLHELLKPYLT
jgi:8-amino-7-oxononanoate synthase